MAKTDLPRVIGPLLGLYSDLGSGLLNPERARIEALQFRCRIDPTGGTTFSTPAATMLANFAFAIRKIVGFALNEDSIGNAAALIDFNIEEQGRSSAVFKRPVSFAAAIKGALEWEGAYIAYPGTTLDVTWAIDSTRWPTFVNTQREVGIQLIGELIAVNNSV